MKPREVLGYSGPLTVVQLVMRSDGDPADTIRQLIGLELRGVVRLRPKVEHAVFEEWLRSVDGKGSREQLRELQTEAVASAQVELLEPAREFQPV